MRLNSKCYGKLAIPASYCLMLFLPFPPRMFFSPSPLYRSIGELSIDLHTDTLKLWWRRWCAITNAQLSFDLFCSSICFILFYSFYNHPTFCVTINVAAAAAAASKLFATWEMKIVSIQVMTLICFPKIFNF